MNVAIALEVPSPPSSLVPPTLDDDAPSTSSAAAILSAAVATATAAVTQSSDAASSWDFDALELCRNCGKVNVKLYDLFTSAGGVAGSAADGDLDEDKAEDISANITATIIATNSKTTDCIATAAASAQQNLNSTCCSDAAVGGGDMTGVLEEMQIWQLRIKPNDGLSQRICLKCFKQYSLIHKFRRKCIKVQSRLRALYEERRLEEQQLLHKKDTPLHLPPELDIGNDLINDNYGQPLSEVELFETAWNASDAPLLDSDASKTEIAVAAGEAEDDDVDGSAVAVELEDAAKVGSDLDAARRLNDSMDLTVKSNIDEESLLDAQSIFKPADQVVIVDITEQCEAPEKIMQSEDEPSSDKPSDELLLLTAKLEDDAVVQTKHDFFEENAVDTLLKQDDKIVTTVTEETKEIVKSEDAVLVAVINQHESKKLNLSTQMTNETTSLLSQENNDSAKTEKDKNKNDDDESAEVVEGPIEAKTNVTEPEKEFAHSGAISSEFETQITLVESAIEAKKTEEITDAAQGEVATVLSDKGEKLQIEAAAVKTIETQIIEKSTNNSPAERDEKLCIETSTAAIEEPQNIKDSKIEETFPVSKIQIDAFEKETNDTQNSTKVSEKESLDVTSETEEQQNTNKSTLEETIPVSKTQIDAFEKETNDTQNSTKVSEKESLDVTSETEEQQNTNKSTLVETIPVSKTKIDTNDRETPIRDTQSFANVSEKETLNVTAATEEPQNTNESTLEKTIKVTNIQIESIEKETHIGHTQRCIKETEEKTLDATVAGKNTVEEKSDEFKVTIETQEQTKCSKLVATLKEAQMPDVNISSSILALDSNDTNKKSIESSETIFVTKAALKEYSTPLKSNTKPPNFDVNTPNQSKNDKKKRQSPNMENENSRSNTNTTSSTDNPGKVEVFVASSTDVCNILNSPTNLTSNENVDILHQNTNKSKAEVNAEAATATAKATTATTKSERKLLFKPKGKFKCYDKKRVGIVSGVLPSQLRACYVRLRRLRVDKTKDFILRLAKTAAVKESTATTTKTRNTKSEFAAAAISHDLKRKARNKAVDDDIITNKGTAEQREEHKYKEKGGNTTSTKKRKYLMSESEEAEIVRKSPWKTKAEMKANVEGDDTKKPSSLTLSSSKSTSLCHTRSKTESDNATWVIEDRFADQGNTTKSSDKEKPTEEACADRKIEYVSRSRKDTKTPAEQDANTSNDLKLVIRRKGRTGSKSKRDEDTKRKVSPSKNSKNELEKRNSSPSKKPKSEEKSPEKRQTNKSKREKDSPEMRAKRIRRSLRQETKREKTNLQNEEVQNKETANNRAIVSTESSGIGDAPESWDKETLKTNVVTSSNIQKVTSEAALIGKSPEMISSVIETNSSLNEKAVSESVKVESAFLDTSLTNEQLKVQATTSTTSAQKLHQVTTNVINNNNNIKTSSDVSKENCDKTAPIQATTTATTMPTQSKQLQHTTKNESQIKEIPKELIIRIPLSALTEEFQRIYFKKLSTTIAQEKDNASDTTSGSSQCASKANVTQTTETESLSLPAENFCISAAADCSDAAGALDATVDRATTQTESETDTELQLHSSQYDSEEQSDFNGFSAESDLSDNLNTSVESIESQESIQAERSSDLQQHQSPDPDQNINFNSSTSKAYSKINDFINEFQTQCLDASEFDDPEDPSVHLNTSANEDATLPLLSASNLSEMNDVETTLNGILNEMQDQHIYTPVSSHTDDFFNQSVYSPLSEPPETPTHSMYAESPGGVGGYISVESSPYVHHHHTPHHQHGGSSSAHITDFANFPNYAGDCFTEDSTQSELIGFQNDIPCFENIELTVATTPSSASNTPTRYTQTHATMPVAATTVNTNSALQGALPTAKTIVDATAVAGASNIQFLGMSSSGQNNMNVGASLGNVMGLVCTSGNGVQVHTPAFTTSAATAELTASVPANVLEGAIIEKQYATDKATMHLNQLLNDLQQQQQQQQQLVLQVSNESATTTTSGGGATTFVHSNQLFAASSSARHNPNQPIFTKISQRPLATQTQTTHEDVIGGSNTKLQFITLSQGNVTDLNAQQQQINAMNLYATTTHNTTNQANVPTQEIQWTTTGAASTNATDATGASPEQTTTTTYYINAADLYQSDLITSTHATAVGSNVGALTALATAQHQQQQQQQQQTVELLDKHSMDANENYIEGMQNQPVMIIIPHEYIRDVGGNVAVAANGNTNAQQVFSSNQQELGTFTLTQTTTHPQTVLVQTNNNNSNTINSSPNQITTHFIATPVASPQRPSGTGSPLQQQQALQTPPPPQQQSSVEQKINLMCRFCVKRPKFTNNLDYSNHIIATHPAENPYNCPHCPLYFTKRVKRQQHIVEDHAAHRFQCAQCGQNFCAQRALDLHLQRYHAPLESTPQQQQRFVRAHVPRSAANAWQHQHDQSPLVRVEDVHLHVSEVEGKDKKAIDLELDGSHLSTEPSTSTQSANKPQRILCCPDCEEPYDDPNNPEGHTHTHAHQTEHPAHHVTMASPEQTEPDSTSTTTLRHFRKRRMSTAKMSAAAAAASSAATSASNAAAAAAAADQLAAERVLRNSHNCLFCEERYTNEIALRKHHQLAHGNQASMPFVCSICKRGFRMRTALQRHMETHDAEGRPYECSWCHVRFPRPSQLTLHKLTVHFLKKPHSCEECGKQFGTESSLKTHIKFHGEPSIQCDLCSQKFFLPKDLRKHRRIHNGERFYKCDLCPSSFLHYTRLSAHTKTHIPLGMYLEETAPILTTGTDPTEPAEQEEEEDNVQEEEEVEEDVEEEEVEEEEILQQTNNEVPQAAAIATVDSA